MHIVLPLKPNPTNDSIEVGPWDSAGCEDSKRTLVEPKPYSRSHTGISSNILSAMSNQKRRIEVQGSEVQAKSLKAAIPTPVFLPPNQAEREQEALLTYQKLKRKAEKDESGTVGRVLRYVET